MSSSQITDYTPHAFIAVAVIGIAAYAYDAHKQSAARDAYQAMRAALAECTQDCSGHRAGYAWAERRGIDNPDDCGGSSQSFINGCKSYVYDTWERDGEP